MFYTLSGCKLYKHYHVYQEVLTLSLCVTIVVCTTTAHSSLLFTLPYRTHTPSAHTCYKTTISNIDSTTKLIVNFFNALFIKCSLAVGNSFDVGINQLVNIKANNDGKKPMLASMLHPFTCVGKPSNNPSFSWTVSFVPPCTSCSCVVSACLLASAASATFFR